MKKVLILFLILFFSTSYVYSQEETTDSPTPTVKEEEKKEKEAENETDDKIQELKEKVADKVAELKKEKLGGITGNLQSASEEALIITIDEVEYSVQLDEDTHIYSLDKNLKKQEIKLTDIDKNEIITVIGTIDTEEKTAQALVIVKRTSPLSLVGKVDSVSTKDGTITLTTLEGETQTVDYEVSTKSLMFDPQKQETVKIGLSKITEGAKIHVWAIKNEETTSALRILILPDSLQVSKEKVTPTKSEEKEEAEETTKEE